METGRKAVTAGAAHAPVAAGLTAIGAWSCSARIPAAFMLGAMNPSPDARGDDQARHRPVRTAREGVAHAALKVAPTGQHSPRHALFPWPRREGRVGALKVAPIRCGLDGRQFGPLACADTRHQGVQRCRGDDGTVMEIAMRRSACGPGLGLGLAMGTERKLDRIPMCRESANAAA